MALIPCPLPHIVYLVLPRERVMKANQDYPGTIPLLTDQIEVDFRARKSLGIPTLVSTNRQDEPQFTFCTPRYEVVCGMTSQKDAYYAYRVSPLSIRTHNQIARGAVSVQTLDWQFVEAVSDINRQARGIVWTVESGYQKILDAWKRTQVVQPNSPPVSVHMALTSAQQTFLADMETLIGLARQAEQDKAALKEATAVTDVEPVARARLAGDIYRFRLAGSIRFVVGDYVRTQTSAPGGSGPGEAGVIAEVEEKAVVIRFHKTVDLELLRRVEWLIPWVSTKQYDIQDDAVKALKEGRSLNRNLLPVIVDGSFTPYTAPVITGGQGRLNAAQLTMIERALHVPDLLLALGPPGTGKTHTIREIVAREIAQHPGQKRRILITSKNNRAVDNVLEGLRGIDALRIGREEAISQDIRPLMIDNKAQDLQQNILSNIHPALENLDRLYGLWSQVEQQLDLLARLAGDLLLGQTRLDQLRETLFSWQKAGYKKIEPVLARQTHRYQVTAARAEQVAKQAEALRHQAESVNRASRLPLIGSFFVLWADKLYRRWKAAFNEYRQIRKEMVNTEKAVYNAWIAYQRHVSTSQEALDFKRPVAEAEAQLEKIKDQAAQVSAGIAQIIKCFENAPLVSARPTPQEIAETRWKLRNWYDTLMLQRQLLHDWQELLQTRHQALYPTLIQLADVVGATCIGVATDARFDDLEFDLVIADEAGQIQAMDLLVPLVRAHRAVLVGDHQQLPPVANDEVDRRIDPEDEELRTWLEKSLFEQLFARETTPETHKIMLDTQYRMPKPIADFISRHFYENKYRTGQVRPCNDPFFIGSNMVFIDTAQEPNRWDKPYRPTAEEKQGYTNELEVRLIATLALAYQEKNMVWGVIVPYKKQAERIRIELLRKQRGFTEDELKESVATVDSFQGKERDVIIYGFTRSNSHGNVGFLSELRRLNVSLTRARQQLILVGDSNTLTRATDRPFADLCRSLIDTIKSTPGGYMNASELREHLRD